MLGGGGSGVKPEANGERGAAEEYFPEKDEVFGVQVATTPKGFGVQGATKVWGRVRHDVNASL